MRRAALVFLPLALIATAAARAEPHALARMPTLASLPGFRAVTAVVGRTRTVAHPGLCRWQGAYGWPVRPFFAPHPVRGNFGDPRTIYLPAGAVVSFHNGIDVAAPAGTPVYPVVSGVAEVASVEEVVVVAPDGRRFQYWHLSPAVRSGRHVVARRTVLGYVQARAGHVHLSEIDDGVVTNPLAPGHLGPYRDRRPPRVRGLSLRTATGRRLSPDRLRGVVHVVAWADDSPSLAVPEPWRGLPVAPAVLSWQLLAPPGTVVARGTGFDVRRTIPDNDRFWSVYAPGTYQNAPVVGDTRPLGVPGRYLYRLASIDTATLAAGIYVLSATAADVCGNSASLSIRVRVLPHPVAPPPAPSPLPLPLPGPGAQPEPGPVAWPQGRTAYTVVLASVPQADPSAAQAKAAAAVAAGLPSVGVLDSGDYRSLAPGYAVVFSGMYSSAAEATDAAIAARSRYAGAYPRLVVSVPARSEGLSLGHVRTRRPPLDVVLASVPLSAGLAGARAEARRAHAAGAGRVRVLRSARLAGFRRGYFVILGERTVSAYPSAYTRRIVLRS